MKFIIDIDEFWLDEEKELEPALKTFIIKTVIQQIHKSIESKVEVAVTKEAHAQVEKTLFRKIQSIVTKFVSEGKVKADSYDKEAKLTIEEYIKKQFEDNSNFRSPTKKIQELASKFGEELKKRYDLLFASQIVASLNNNGLLKENVAKMLLETIDKK
jgi:hypothetical protein